MHILGIAWDDRGDRFCMFGKSSFPTFSSINLEIILLEGVVVEVA